MISDFRKRLCFPRMVLLLSAAGAAPVSADDVVFLDESSLSGKVTALSEDGRLILASPLSHEPLELRSNRIHRVLFAPKDPEADLQDALIQLANGDIFPCDLEEIDSSTVRARTSFAGNLTIPRAAVHTLQLGMRPLKVIYRGPSDPGSWQMSGDWRLENGRFISESSGNLARNFEIPGSFSLKFRVHWKTTPHLTVHFAEGGSKTEGSTGRYVLRFNSGGFELKREIEGESRRNPPMIQLPSDPVTLSRNVAEIDLRLDRKLNQVHLYVNGDYEGRFPDPLGQSPSGGNIRFLSGAGDDGMLMIEQIELREWDPSADRHRTEERGDFSQDAIILRDGQRGPAQILALRSGAGGGDIEFKSPHLPKNETLPASEISTLFFARTEQEKIAPSSMTLELRGRGQLGLSSCTFTGEMLHARHPLLGDLRIRRDCVARLERPRATENSTENNP